MTDYFEADSCVVNKGSRAPSPPTISKGFYNKQAQEIPKRAQAISRSVLEELVIAELSTYDEFEESTDDNQGAALVRYLRSLDSHLKISTVMANHVRQWWSEMTAVLDPQKVPMADLTADETAFQFAWSYPHLLIEMEVTENGAAWWFAKDRDANKFANGEFKTGDDLSSEFIEWLQRL